MNLILLVVAIVIIVIVVIAVFIFRSRNSKDSSTRSNSSSGSSGDPSGSKKLGVWASRWPRQQTRNFNPNGADDPNIPNPMQMTSRYAIALPPDLEAYRSKIFQIHIDDIKLPQDLKTDTNYPKIVNALKTLNRAPTIEELQFMLKYKHFLDMSSVYSMAGPKDIDQLYLVLLNIIVNKIPGDFIETGTWRGGMGLFAKAIFNHYSSSNPNLTSVENRISDGLPRRVILFDAFDEFPAPEPAVLDPSTGTVILNPKDSMIHSITKMMYDKPANVTEVRDAFRSFGLLDDNVSLVKGLFSNTIPAAVNSGLIDSDRPSIAVLRIDSDYYDSVYFVLEELYHKIHKGGFLICDDYNNPIVGCKEAVDRFRAENNITSRIVDTYGGAIYWQV